MIFVQVREFIERGDFTVFDPAGQCLPDSGEPFHVIVSACQLIADGPSGQLTEASLSVPNFMGDGGGVRVGAEDDDVTAVFGLEATEIGLAALVMDALIGYEDELGGAERPAYTQNFGDLLDIYGAPSQATNVLLSVLYITVPILNS